MRRGEIWTIAGGKDYAGKPRPALIVQDDAFEMTASVTICAFTTEAADAPLIRIPIEPDVRNGLKTPCRLMVDKITTVPRSSFSVWSRRTCLGNRNSVRAISRTAVVHLMAFPLLAR